MIDAGTKYLAISLLVLLRSRGLGYFQAYDAKETLLSGVEHARPGIASARDIANHRRKSRLNVAGSNAGNIM